jgi:hypothetical protein
MLGFALSRSGADVFATFADRVGIGLVVIVVFVVRLEAGQALFINDRLAFVRKFMVV